MSSTASLSNPEPGEQSSGYGSTQPYGQANLQSHIAPLNQHTTYITAAAYASAPSIPPHQVAAAPVFTAAMRNSQARGKETWDESSDGMTVWEKQNSHGESFEIRERRAYALSVLNNRELLMQWAHQNGDSVAGARLKFTRIMCGFENETNKEVDRRIAKNKNKWPM